MDVAATNKKNAQHVCVQRKRPFGGRLRRTVLLFDTHYIFYEHKDARKGDVIYVARVCAAARRL